MLGKNIAVDGGLYAWGGNVTLDVPRLATAVSDGYGSPEPGLIRIGSEAVIDVAARSATAVDRLGRRYGIVADGGTIALGGGLDWEDTGSAKAADAFIVIETGALLDASGTQATLDLPSTMGMPSITTQVVSDGGTIVAKSNVGLYLDGTVKAEAGGKGAAGGTLGLALESAAYRVGKRMRTCSDRVNSYCRRSRAKACFLKVSASMEFMVTLSRGPDISEPTGSRLAVSTTSRCW
ncbi:hypothetical protein ACFSUK_33635 [Sphingobium scionense]